MTDMRRNALAESDRASFTQPALDKPASAAGTHTGNLSGDLSRRNDMHMFGTLSPEDG
jgi:hypothetical protein